MQSIETIREQAKLNDEQELYELRHYKDAINQEDLDAIANLLDLTNLPEPIKIQTLNFAQWDTKTALNYLLRQIVILQHGLELGSQALKGKGFLVTPIETLGGERVIGERSVSTIRGESRKVKPKKEVSKLDTSLVSNSKSLRGRDVEGRDFEPRVPNMRKRDRRSNYSRTNQKPLHLEKHPKK